MFQTLADKVPRDRKLPERAWCLDVLNRVLDGTIYDVLRCEFHEEQTDAGEYIQLRKRRPCVRYNLCRLVVDDTTALLFGEGRFPAITSEAKQDEEAFAELAAECGLPQLLHEAAWRGSVGSSAILFRVLKQRPFFNVMDTRYLTPVWQKEAPDTLEKVVEKYRVRGEKLREVGYDIADEELSANFWFQRIWDDQAETWFIPWRSDLPDPVTGKEPTPVVDPQRSVTHQLGFVPVVWMRNLPGGDDIDGACTFRPAVETQIEIDYQLSQAGRGLKYSADPLLMIREPAAPDGQIMRSASNALLVAENGDARMLEINGTAVAAVMDYVRMLREMALEQCHGNRSSADRLTAAQSGRALELLHQPLVQLADVLRTSYGVNGLLPLLRMVAQASTKMPLKLRKTTLRNLTADTIGLRWQPWFDATESDKLEQAQTLNTLRNAGMISRETAVAVVAPNYDVEDEKAELARIKADEVDADKRLAAQAAAQTKATETLPG